MTTIDTVEVNAVVNLEEVAQELMIVGGIEKLGEFVINAIKDRSYSQQLSDIANLREMLDEYWESINQ